MSVSIFSMFADKFHFCWTGNAGIEMLLYLPDRHTAHAWVQHAGPSTGTHLAGEGEPLPPSDTVGLHRLPVAAQTQKGSGPMQQRVIPHGVHSGSLLTPFLCVCFGNDVKPVHEHSDSIRGARGRLCNRSVSPSGVWDLWAGPSWSFQSRGQRPDFCCRGLMDLSGEIRPARSANSLSLISTD